MVKRWLLFTLICCSGLEKGERYLGVPRVGDNRWSSVEGMVLVQNREAMGNIPIQLSTIGRKNRGYNRSRDK